MKRYMLSILPLFLALCLMAGCGGRSGMHSRLAAVDSIVDSRYDSALTVLRGMDTLQMRRSDRMYLELLRAKAMNKASVPFTTDSVMRRVARYYDRHGSPNQRLLAHYLLGCAPRALEEYQRAGREIHVGTNVNPSEPSGPVVFSNGSYVLKGNKVVLHPGTSVSIGTKLKIP